LVRRGTLSGVPGAAFTSPKDPEITRAAGTPVRGTEAGQTSAPRPRPRSVIWIVNQYTGSPRHGMEYRHFYLGRELAAQGHEVVVLSGSYSHLFTRQPDTPDTYTLEDVDGMRYCWVRVPRYGRAISVGRVLNMLAFALRLTRLPAERLPRPDAILVSSPSLFPIANAARWARRWDAELIFEVRDIWPLTLRELGGMSRLHPLVLFMQLFEDYGYRVADRVVSVLPGALGHMVSRGMDPSKFHCVPNGIDLRGTGAEGIPPDAVADAIRPDAFTVGFVGTLGTANALETLIDAARLVKADGIQVVLVGHGPEREQLAARAAGLSNVTFTGPIPKEQVASALQLFDACYVGYRRSSLYRFGVAPNKLYDYMAAGRPIVFAAEAFNRPVEEADCGRSVAPEDPAALAAAIRELAAEPPEERARLGANAQAFVAGRHDYAVLADELAGILLDVRR
jgi:glycosyltransferase involved in cell wall biosynthesis